MQSIKKTQAKQKNTFTKDASATKTGAICVNNSFFPASVSSVHTETYSEQKIDGQLVKTLKICDTTTAVFDKEINCDGDFTL